MEKYCAITTVTDQNLANRICAVLEDANIPVMLEHVEVVDNYRRDSGYRILVPSGNLRKAIRLFEGAAVAFHAQNDVRTPFAVIH